MCNVLMHESTHICKGVCVCVCVCDADSCSRMFVQKEIYLKANECSKTKTETENECIWQQECRKNQLKMWKEGLQQQQEKSHTLAHTHIYGHKQKHTWLCVWHPCCYCCCLFYLYISYIFVVLVLCSCN